MKYILVSVAAVVLALGAYWFGTTRSGNEAPPIVIDIAAEQPATSTPNLPVDMVISGRGPVSVIGTSTSGAPLTAYHFGTGETELLFIGGIHGGYSWSTNLLAYELVDHLTKNPSLVPDNVTITIIPTLNPDGLERTTGTTTRFTKAMVKPGEAAQIAGRFNANDVDLNRNFDCEWSSESKWQNRTVSGGTAAFSEREAAALRDYVVTHRPNTVVAWYAAEGAVYTSSCGGTVSASTTALVATYAQASGYTANQEFDSYAISGDMVNWFAKQNIPAISVLLSSNTATDWEKNRAGVEALINSFAN